MAYLSRNDIEALGAQVFADYKRLPCLQGQRLQQVEPEILARNLLGLNVDHCHLSRSGAVLGLTACTQVGISVLNTDGNRIDYFLDGKTILIESDLRDNDEQRGRYHFTIVHEAAHQILDMLYPEHGGVAARIHYSILGAKQNYPVTDWAEWQANVLASVLLMPAELVMSALLRFDLAGGIRTLNKVFFPKEYERFCQVADTLGVSRQALSIRMKQLNMLGESYLDDPYRLVDVEVDEKWQE